MWAVWQLSKLKTNKSKTCLSFMCISISILFMASGVSYAVHIAQSIFCSEPVSWTQTGCIAIACYMVALSFLYIFYVFRLQFTFQNTQYALSYAFVVVFFIGFVVQIGCILVATLFLLQNNITIGLKVYSGFNVCNFVFNVLLIVIFVGKIYSLSHQTSKGRKNNSVKALLSPTVRYIICACVSLFSSNLLSTFGIIRAEVRPTQALRVGHIVLIVLDQGVNSYFLYLQYSFGDKQYEKRCQKCHNWFLGCFAQAVHSAVGISKEMQNPQQNTTETRLKFGPGGSITSTPHKTDESTLKDSVNSVADEDPSTQCTNTTTSELRRQQERDRKFISNVKSIECKS
eukprot:186772_1